MITHQRTAWAIKFVSDNGLDGHRENFVHHLGLVLFRTRQEGRDYRDKHYGYIRERPDLKAKPHGWRLPQVVKVQITVEEHIVTKPGRVRCGAKVNAG